MFCGVNGVGKSTNLAKVNLEPTSSPQTLIHPVFPLILLGLFLVRAKWTEGDDRSM